ncbi:MAG TPA: hypothetical protein VNC50_15825, partial [Planctomycetia bacterium]|nr:hypothetical protein [Planctomycetia bacterium]
KATADEGELFSGMGSETYHRSREEGFGVGRTPRWSAGVMAKVFECLEEACPEAAWDWTSLDSARRKFPGIGQAWARVRTKLPRCVEINLVGPKGAFNLSQVEEFGARTALRTEHADWDAIRFEYSSLNDFSAPRWTDFLALHAESFRRTMKNRA